MVELSDAELVQATLADANAYGRLISRHQAKLHRYVRRLLGGNAATADDVLQDVFIKAYLNLNDFDLFFKLFVFKNLSVFFIPQQARTRERCQTK